MLMQKKILDHINEAILLFDQQLNLLYINAAGEELFTDSARHLIGQNAQQLFRLSSSLIIDDIKQCLKDSKPILDQGLDFYLLNKLITINLAITPLPDDISGVEILVEIQQVDHHIKISKSEQLLNQHHTTQMLVRSMAHEIKNPLGGLRGAAQLLEAELDSDELKEYTQIIISESDRLQTLVDKMLGPNMLPNKSLLNIHQVLEHVRQLVEAESPKKITIIRDFDPSIPEIYADKNQLIQAILNITRNAAQAINEQGTITLKTRIRRQMTIRRIRYKLSVQIDIIDDGIGIAPDLIDQIFYPMIKKYLALLLFH